LSYTDVVLKPSARRPVLERRPSNRAESFEDWVRDNSLETETFGETKRLVVVREKKALGHKPRVIVKEVPVPRRDYIEVRNVSEEQSSELRRFGRVMAGYPIRPREFYRQAALRLPENERPVCPIHHTDRYVHWVGRNHWTCKADHRPIQFGMLRLT